MNHSINAKHNPSTQEIQLLKICMCCEQSQQKVHNKRDKNSIRWKLSSKHHIPKGNEFLKKY